jgi:hypothetical protein
MQNGFKKPYALVGVHLHLFLNPGNIEALREA